MSKVLVTSRGDGHAEVLLSIPGGESAVFRTLIPEVTGDGKELFGEKRRIAVQRARIIAESMLAIEDTV